MDNAKSFSRVFDMQDQAAFARLSGDYNELHMDEIAARRSLFGSPVVHGMNTLLWALDAYLPESPQTLGFARLKAMFTHQIKVGDEVRIEPVKIDGHSIRLKILSGATVAATIKVTFSEQNADMSEVLLNSDPKKGAAVEIEDTAIANAGGELALHLNQDAVQAMYPRLSKHLNPAHIAIILASTRIVGMRCPGRHSLYSELALQASDPAQGDRLQYKTESYDDRFGLIEMALLAPGLTGEIRAFKRPEPQVQAPYVSLSETVKQDEFGSQNALIIGGSRGLGEVTAKLLAAGGADVRITYHRGATEAEAVVSEILSGGGKAASMQMNVLEAQQPDTGWQPTHIYYFATPFITPGIPGSFSQKLFRNFCDYYIGGLLNVSGSVTNIRNTHLFVPSSVYVEDAPDNLQEYAAAKMAAEIYCNSANSLNPDAVIYAPRLPRMATDQTANVAGVESDDPAPILLRELRQFCSSENQ